MDWLSAVASTSGDAIAEGIRRGNNFNAGAYYTNLAAQNYGIAQATGGMMRSSAQQMMAANSQRQAGGPSIISSPARAIDMFKANAFGAAARGSMNAYVRSNDPIDRMNAAQAFRANTMAAGLASLNTAIVDTGVQGAQTYAMGVGAEAAIGVTVGKVIGTRAAAVFAAESNIARGLSGTSVVSPARAEAFLVKNGFAPTRAQEFITSFDGPITARIVRPGEEFLRYTDDAMSTGSFLTKTRFPNSTSAVDGLYLSPFPNRATLMQPVTSTGRSIVLEGGIRNSGAGIGQTVIHNRGTFYFGPGVGY